MSGASFSVSSPNCSSISALDDIEYLLHLEALKRFTEDEKNIRRQVDEHSRQLMEAKQEYLTYYEKYTTILKLIGTRHLLESKSQLNSTLVNAAGVQINEICENIASGLSTVYLDEQQLSNCKSKLNTFRDYPNLNKQKTELAENRETVRAIHNSAEIVETTLEASTLLSMQQLVVDMQENLLSE